MNHKWELTELPENLTDTFKSKWICKICQCEKLKSKWDGHFQYSRSKIFNINMPECINWLDRESLNKID